MQAVGLGGSWVWDYSQGGEGRGRNGHPKARAQCGIASGVSPGKVEVRGRVRRDASYLELV